MSAKLIREIFNWVKSGYNNNSEETLRNLIARWPSGTSPSLLVSNGEKLGHFAKRTHERLYQLLRQVHHGTPKGEELDPKGKWRKVGMGLLAAGGIPGVGVYSNISRTASLFGSDFVAEAKANACLEYGDCRGGKRRATRRRKGSNRTKRNRY